MILGDPAQAPAQAPRGQIRVSIDEMFRRLAERRPDAPALADPPNRKNFTDGAPRRLTYAEADRMVAAIAGRLRRMGLPVDAVIGVQMPNIVENILAMLGVLRAGMVVAPLPLLWRRRRGRRARPRRRQGADHLRARRRFQARPVRHARGRGSVRHPLRVRLRRQPA